MRRYSRTPAALVPRFARYSGMLGNFLGPREFHEAFPVGLDFDGNPVPPHKKVEYPVFGHDSLERLVGELLLPALVGKRHSSLANATQPLALAFVKTLLPELEQLYISEATTRSDAPAAASEASMLEDTDATEEAPVTDKEAQALQEQYETAKEALLDVLATEQMSRYIVFLRHDDASLMDKLMGQPMLNDGSVTQRFSLNRSHYGLYVPAMTWRSLENFSSGSVCLVLASERYTEDDYYRSYEDFTAALRAPVVPLAA